MSRTGSPVAIVALFAATAGRDASCRVNQLLADVYAAAGDPVADVEAAFSTGNVGDGDADGVPDDVEQACAWTWRCTPPPHGPDIHPKNAGYDAIAGTFAAVLRSLN